MIPNTNITQDDAKWLIDFYKPRMSYQINQSSIQWHLKAFNLIKGANEKVPSCPCHWVSGAKMAQSLFSQYETEIQQLYEQPVKTTRGRKRKT